MQNEFESEFFNDILNEEDIEEMNRLLKFKKDLMAYVGIDKVIEFTKEAIDNSKSFEFKSEVARKFINKNKPIFVIKIADENLLKETKEEKNESKAIDNITRIIGVEIVNKISDYLIGNIHENEELDEIYDSLSNEMKNFVFTNIYIIRSSLKENTINFEYFL